ncbi:putative extracellular serine-rich protein [Saccharata proteae CBS 121410]|uniref:Putative extracellular serine-rich protein n=1 Tax=Saccharata proteae CBS 121410 TaxID=1314787 RepID=A0A6A5YAY7_9PEZI|nr:putative extracellular serine-rich protein [Saccharata proteae CBS 121410]
MARPDSVPFPTFLLVLAISCIAKVANALAVANTILILARDSTSAYSAYSGFNGYGIPYQVVTVPQDGVTLPTLNSSATSGNYGGIVVLSEVSYQYNTSFESALTTAQWQQLYDYQTAFSVRMVRLDAYPTADFGTTTAIDGAGCCSTGVEQLVSITNDTGFPTANLKTGATMSTESIWHYPATITNSSIAWSIAEFAPSGDFTSNTVAAVINRIGNREQMVWFTSWATDWAPVSSYLQHAYIHWVTRGLYVGFRRVLLNTQVDDIMLETDLYSPNGTTFRIRPGDLANHITWTSSINSKMPAGSDYFIELGLNGNGGIESATDVDNNVCTPDNAIEYIADNPDTPLEFQKPLGTGTDIWPSTPKTFVWSATCADSDNLTAWFQTAANRDAFSYVTHTFTHESLDNATFADTSKEISFNVAWMTATGFTQATRFSGNGLIPPAITGLHNGDAINAWVQNGLTNGVGDNTRPVLLNTENPFWPYITTNESNGYAGFQVTPRWATTIYYNCDLPDCTLQEWIATSAGSGDFQNLLDNARQVNTQHLLDLRQDPFMFHQANLRQTDVASTVVNGVSGQFSLLQIWVETIVAEYSRLVDWPILTQKHDDTATTFAKRMARDQCKPNLTYEYSADGTQITGVTVTTTGNTCSVPIPVTFPGPVESTQGGTTEQIGSDPLTVWTTLSGSSQSFTLSTPIAVG